MLGLLQAVACFGALASPPQLRICTGRRCSRHGARRLIAAARVLATPEQAEICDMGCDSTCPADAIMCNDEPVSVASLPEAFEVAAVCCFRVNPKLQPTFKRTAHL